MIFHPMFTTHHSLLCVCSAWCIIQGLKVFLSYNCIRVYLFVWQSKTHWNTEWCVLDLICQMKTARGPVIFDFTLSLVWSPFSVCSPYIIIIIKIGCGMYTNQRISLLVFSWRDSNKKTPLAFGSCLGSFWRLKNDFYFLSWRLPSMSF